VALAADALYQFTQKVEAQNLQHLLYGTASAKSVTYQAKIKSDWAGTMTLYVIAPDGSRSYAAPLVVAGDESQETFTFTLPGDASGAINNDTGVGFDWMITLAGGSNFQGGTTGAWAASNNNMYAASNSGNSWADIRSKRDGLLAATDWWAVSDRAISAAEAAYRQALRDVPQTFSSPADVVWPTKPA
jgi:hypothetical protein